MQKHTNLVDLVKSFPTNILLQNLASIQKRTSPIKFAHLAEKSKKGSISNLSTQARTPPRTAAPSASWARTRSSPAATRPRGPSSTGSATGRRASGRRSTRFAASPRSSPTTPRPASRRCGHRELTKTSYQIWQIRRSLLFRILSTVWQKTFSAVSAPAFAREYEFGRIFEI